MNKVEWLKMVMDRIERKLEVRFKVEGWGMIELKKFEEGVKELVERIEEEREEEFDRLWNEGFGRFVELVKESVEED